MSNRTWACFHCRQSVRRPARYGDEAIAEVVSCPECGGACVSLGYRIPIPPRHDEKAWAGLHAWILGREDAETRRTQLAEVRRRHEVEREIARLEERPENPERSRLVRRLRRILERGSR